MGKCLGEALRPLASRLYDERAAANLAIGGYAVATGAPHPCRQRLSGRGAGNRHSRYKHQAEPACLPQPRRHRGPPCAHGDQASRPRAKPLQGSEPITRCASAAAISHPLANAPMDRVGASPLNDDDEHMGLRHAPAGASVPSARLPQTETICARAFVLTMALFRCRNQACGRGGRGLLFAAAPRRWEDQAHTPELCPERELGRPPGGY
jgi:hypothetical protein